MDLRQMTALACLVLCFLWLASGVLFDYDPHAITNSTVFAAAVRVLLGTRE